MEHTPGPWRILESEWNGADHYIISGYGADTSCICKMTEDNEEANAQLIAAAPELLEACEEWLGTWLYLRDKYPDIEIPLTLRGGSDACGRLRAAITKAKGD